MDHSKIKETILYTFEYGSHVYGTNTNKSDKDYIVVVDVKEELEYGIHNEEMNITVYSDKTFKRLINEHHIAALECIFSNETDYEFHLNLEQLRRSISAIVSNSFVKCKKKLMPGKDYNPYIGKKSLFHSIRILDFGIQIAENGKIVDFTSCNHLFKEIMEINSDDWDLYRKKFEPVAKELKKKFKQIAPLKKDENKNRKKEW